eukprot:scaffold108940_cov62-Attheya_sp.AAC.2
MASAKHELQRSDGVGCCVANNSSIHSYEYLEHGSSVVCNCMPSIDSSPSCGSNAGPFAFIEDLQHQKYIIQNILFAPPGHHFVAYGSLAWPGLSSYRAAKLDSLMIVV